MTVAYVCKEWELGCLVFWGRDLRIVVCSEREDSRDQGSGPGGNGCWMCVDRVILLRSSTALAISVMISLLLYRVLDSDTRYRSKQSIFFLINVRRRWNVGYVGALCSRVLNSAVGKRCYRAKIQVLFPRCQNT